MCSPVSAGDYLKDAIAGGRAPSPWARTPVVNILSDGKEAGDAGRHGAGLYLSTPAGRWTPEMRFGSAGEKQSASHLAA